MLRMLALFSLSLILGCGKSIEGSREPCAGAKSDNGNGTTTVACLNGTKDLVCTHLDCAGMSSPLLINETDLTRVILTRLTTISYLEIIGNPILTAVSLPALTSVPGSDPWLRSFVVERNTALASLDLPTLASVRGGLDVAENAALKSLSLPALTSAGSVMVNSNPTLTSVSLPALATTSTVSTFEWNPAVHILGNAALTSLSLPALRVGLLAVQGNTALPECEALTLLSNLRAAGFDGLAHISGNKPSAACPTTICPGVAINDSLRWAALVDRGCTEIAGDLSVVGTNVSSMNLAALSAVDGSLDIGDNSALRSVSLPSLTTVGLRLIVDGNAVLKNLDLSALTRLQIESGTPLRAALEIQGNSVLPECQAVAILARLQAAGFNNGDVNGYVITGNDTTATCP